MRWRFVVVCVAVEAWEKEDYECMSSHEAKVRACRRGHEGVLATHVDRVDGRTTLAIALRGDRARVQGCDTLPPEEGQERGCTSDVDGSGSRWKWK